jgi:chloramphenicol O-acetyltransferase type B
MSLAQRIKAAIRPRREPENDFLQREGRLSIGRHTYGDPRIITWRTPDGRWMCDRVTIGAFCSIGPEVQIFTGGHHRIDLVTSFPFHSRWDLPGRDVDREGLGHGDVIIGNDVWIATGAWIMSGVTIGDGAVVGARALVTRDVRPYAKVVGTPAKEVSRRFDDETVDHLLALKGWDWPDEKILNNVDKLLAVPHFPTLSRV